VFAIDFEKDDLIVTFNGIIRKTPFISTVKRALELLSEKLGTPVDIEFACNGDDFYLLQCRPQSYSQNVIPSPIPHDIPEKDILFTADRYVSNGPGARHHPCGVCRSRWIRERENGTGTGAGRRSGEQAQLPAAEKTVHPDGTWPLGKQG
jgi:hypothetical protein